MTRQDIRTALTALAVVVLLGLGIGFAVGSFTAPRDQVLSAPPEGPAEFDGGGPTVEGIPGWRDVYVNDYEDLLGPEAEAEIRGELIALYDRTGIEMTVLTIPDMISYGWSGTIEEFATRLFNTWGIGNAETNDGVLILVSRFDRQMRIELGAGYPRSRDADMQRVIDDAFLPAFRRDAYQEGILRGVDETIFELTGAYPGSEDLGTVARGWFTIGRWALDYIWAPIIAGIGALGGAVTYVRRYLRRRERPCPDCGTLMWRAPEEADDEHLDGGQRLEEYLGSVDYDVWHCPSCAHITILRYRNWFSGARTCPGCDYRTLETTSEVLRPATTKMAGSKRLTYSCRNCSYHDTEVRTIPAIGEGSSSGGGGSSRSSFGGGSSRGGGASGSW